MHLYLSSYRIGDEPQKLQELFAKNPTIGFIPNACDYSDSDPEKRAAHIQTNIDSLEDLVLKVTMIDLRDYFGKKDELRSVLETLGGVWVSGGNTFVLRQAMKLSGFDELLIDECSKKSDFVYAGYSAGGCVLSPSLKSYAIVDDAMDHPYPQCTETIWEGLGLIDFAFMPHFDSNHPESDDVNLEVAYCEQHHIPYKTLRDGEVIIL